MYSFFLEISFYLLASVYAIVLIINVADPFHFDTAPDPRIRFVESRTRREIEKIRTFFYKVRLPKKMIYYLINIRQINSNEEKILNCDFLCI